MRINLVCMGKTADRTVAELIGYYEGRLPKFWNFTITELSDVKNARNMTPDLLKTEEGKVFLNYFEAADHVVLLDEGGAQYTSRQFATKINAWMSASVRRIVFVVGGAYGFSDEVYARANEKMSLSKMTFTHQMIRLFFTEQLYRADQILQGKPYHND